MEKINREILKSEDPLVSFLLSPAIDGKTSEQIADIYNDTHTPRIPVNKIAEGKKLKELQPLVKQHRTSSARTWHVT